MSSVSSSCCDGGVEVTAAGTPAHPAGYHGGTSTNGVCARLRSVGRERRFRARHSGLSCLESGVRVVRSWPSESGHVRPARRGRDEAAANRAPGRGPRSRIMVKEAGRGRDEAAAKPGSWPWAEEPDNGQRGRPWPARPSRGRAMGWGLTGDVMREVKQHGPGGGPVCRSLGACRPSGAGPREKANGCARAVPGVSRAVRGKSAHRHNRTCS